MRLVTHTDKRGFEYFGIFDIASFGKCVSDPQNYVSEIFFHGFY